MPVLTKINTNSIAEDAITGDKFAGDAYLSNTANQNISGTYSENRLYTSDAYTLSGNATINSHLTLSSVKPTADVVLTAGGAYTITGTGVLSAGSLLAKERTDLTGMTGELGSTVTQASGYTLGSGVIGTNSFEIVNRPCFVATRTSGLAIATSTWTAFADSAILNAGNCYNTSSYTFTPNKAGWYWLYVNGGIDDVGDGNIISAGIFKNSISTVTRVREMRVGHSSSAKGVDISSIEYANGTTDYFWFAMSHGHGSNRTLIGNAYAVAMGFKLAI